MNRNSPERIYLEPTTRCNLRCRMCVKYAPGSHIEERDLDPLVFQRLLPALSNARHLIINGIGEPLLHPQLETFVSLARARLPSSGTIGLQSNAVLLDAARATGLLEAGLSTLCLSLDGRRDTPSAIGEPGGHSIGAVDKAIDSIQAASRRTGISLRLGLELVIHRHNYRELPELVGWASERGVAFLLVSHLYHYAAMQDDLFDPNPAPARALFRRHRARAQSQGFDMLACLTVFNTFDRTADSRAKQAVLNDICNEATQQGIHLHLASLIERQNSIDQSEVREVFSRSEQLARAAGIDLDVPPLGAPAQRTCRFLEDRAVCIAADGRVMPCHFLWHACTCHVSGKAITVRPRSFGSLRDRDLESIWHAPDYRLFREEAGKYQYAPCWSCPQGPCPDLVSGDSGYANDCYGSTVPCGHCQWSLGGIRCLS